jgi:hypothetical protein
MDALREVIAFFGFKTDFSPLDAASKRLDQLKSKVKEAGSSFSLSRVNEWAKGTVESMQGVAGEIRKVALQTGLSTRAVQEWGFAGLAPENLAKSVIHLQKEMAEAAKKGGDASRNFKGLGISLLDSSGKMRKTEDVLTEVGTAIAGLPDETQRTAKAFEIFSRRGIDILQVFNKGPEELAKLRARFAELGGGISDKAIAKLAKLGKAEKELKAATTSLKGELAGALAPGMTAVAQKMADLAAWFGRVAEKSRIVEVAVAVLGTIAVAQAIKMYGAYLPWIALLVVAALAVEDLYTTFTGGHEAKTITNRLADALGGLIVGTNDTSSAWFQFLDGLVGTGKVGDAVSVVFDKIKGALSSAGSWLYQAGADLIRGLVDGVTSAAGAAVDAVKGVGVSIRDGIKGVLGIKSPSTVFYDVGVNVDRGMADGLRAGAAAVQNAARASLAPSFAGSVGGSVRTDARQQQVIQNNQVAINVTGNGGPSMVDEIRRGVGLGLSDDRDALLGALEPVGV